MSIKFIWKLVNLNEFVVTIAHSEPEVIALTVAARGILYIRANSPKLPEPVYSPTSLSEPSSLDTTILKVPLVLN